MFPRWGVLFCVIILSILAVPFVAWGVNIPPPGAGILMAFLCCVAVFSAGLFGGRLARGLARTWLEVGTTFEVVSKPVRHKSDGPVLVYLCHLPRPNCGGGVGFVYAYSLGPSWAADAIMRMGVGDTFEYDRPKCQDMSPGITNTRPCVR